MLRSQFFADDPFFVGHQEHMRQMQQMMPFGGGMNHMMALPDGRHNHQLQQQQAQNMGHQEHMRQMQQMMPFGGGMNHMMALPDGRHNHQLQQQQAQNMQVADRGLFMDPFAHFNSMFSNMHSMMSDMRRAFDNGGAMASMNGDGGQVFQQSSFTSYSNTGNGAPQYYQASTSSRRGPDGVCETKKTVRDSESGLNKIAVGHHIQDRGHVIERSRNSKTGEMHENQDYVNLDEDEAQHFEQEYGEKWRSAMRGNGQGRHGDRHRAVGGATRSRYAALPEPEHRRHRRPSNRRE